MGHRWKRLRRVSVTNPGDQYVAPPAVTVDPPAAPKQEAKAVATLDSTGSVNAINLDSGGNFYATLPTITLSAPDSGGTQAEATAVISGGEVTGINITNAGSGYSSPPTVTIPKSTDDKSSFAAQVSVTFDSASGTVTKVNVLDSGNFYDSSNPPNVTIAAPFDSKTFEVGEDVTIAANSTGAVVSGEVAQWIDSSQTLSLIHTSSTSGTFTEPGVGLAITGSNSGATRKISKVTLPEIAGDTSDEFDLIAQDFLDFSETNPFGEPEAATLVQEATAAATAASAPATKMVIKGTVSDPSFPKADKSYKIVGNNLTYGFEADSNNANYVEGLRDLNVPGFTLSTHSDSSVTNAMQITYTPQVTNDTLTLAGDGFTHIGIAEGNYQLNTSDASSPTVGALQAGDSAPVRFGDSADAPESDGSFFRSAATQLIATVNTGKLYTGPTGNVFYLEINEGYIDSGVTDSSMLTDSAFIVSIDSGQGYGGGYGKVFGIASSSGSSGSGGSGSSTIAWGGDRAVVWGGMGGNTPGEKIDYFSIPTPGNATVFGDVHRQVDGYGPGKRGGVCVSDKTYGVYAGGNSEHNYNGTTQIDYITFATPGNSSDFGSLTTNRENQPAGASDGTTGYITGGQESISPWAAMTSTETITIATPGNSATSSFTLATATRHTSGANDATRMIIAGGYTANNNNNSLIQYFTFSTPGTSTTFGNLSDNRAYATATSNDTYALIAGGYENVSSLNLATTDVITIQTTGNATNFGNLNRVNRAMGASSNGTYATFGGGFGSNVVDIDRFNFSSAATATDHGDLINAGEQPGACSGNAA